jgi:hypothetical protein
LTGEGFYGIIVVRGMKGGLKTYPNLSLLDRWGVLRHYWGELV